MVMEIKEHESHLNAILESVTDGEARAQVVEHLEALREDYGATTVELQATIENRDKLKNENEALVISNSKLFREKAIESGNDNQNELEEVEQNLTLDDLGI